MNWPARSLGTLVEIVIIVVAIVLVVAHQLSPELTGALVVVAVAATKL